MYKSFTFSLTCVTQSWPCYNQYGHSQVAEMKLSPYIILSHCFFLSYASVFTNIGIQRHRLIHSVNIHTTYTQAIFEETAKTFQYQPNIFIWGLIFIYWIRREHCHAYNYLISSQILCQSAAAPGILMGQ